MRENHLRWCEFRVRIDRVIKRDEMFGMMRSRRRHKNTLMEIMNKDLNALN